MRAATHAQTDTSAADSNPSLISKVVDGFLIPSAYVLKNNPVSAPFEMLAAGVTGFTFAATAACVVATGAGILVGAAGAALGATLGIGSTAFGLGLPTVGFMLFFGGAMGGCTAALSAMTSMVVLESPLNSLRNKYDAAFDKIDSDRAAKAALKASRAEDLTQRMNMRTEPAEHAPGPGAGLKNSFGSNAPRGGVAEASAAAPSAPKTTTDGMHNNF